jgi:hypothetical protein
MAGYCRPKDALGNALLGGITVNSRTGALPFRAHWLQIISSTYSNFVLVSGHSAPAYVFAPQLEGDRDAQFYAALLRPN